MKQWEQPKLIVLQRGRPEERILLVCKTINGASGSPLIDDYQCDWDTGCEEECDAINAS